MTTRRLFVGIFLLALLALTAKSATDPDFGWHLRTGEYIVTTGSIPHADFFSYTAAGHEWITHEWFSQVLMYLLYRVGGFFALVFFFAVVATLTFWLVYLRCKGQPYLAVFVVLFAALAAAPIWGVRPQTISLFLTSGFLYILDRYRREGNGRLLLWLLPLMLIWANSHGSFALGPFLILIYLVGDVAERILKWNNDSSSPIVKRETSSVTHSPLYPFTSAPAIRDLSLALVACIAIIVVNPNTIALYPYPFQTLSSRVIQTYIQEWQPPNFHDAAIQPFLWMLVVTVGALAASRKRIGLVELILFVGFTYASLRAARQISIWVLITAPILSSALLDLYDLVPWKIKFRLNEPPPRFAQILNGILLGIVALVALLRVSSAALNQAQAERNFFPVAAVEWIQQQGQRGPIFNLYDWGGYLIWKMYPSERVFIDGRSDLYGLTGDQVVTEYLATVNGTAHWRDALEKYQVRLVLIPPDSALTTLLTQEPGWEKSYADDTAVIFERK